VIQIANRGSGPLSQAERKPQRPVTQSLREVVLAAPLE
jgi:hypothetical protein